MVLDIALASGASTTDQIIGALEAAGLMIVPVSVRNATPDAIENPMEWVRGIAAEHGISTTELARIAGLAPSTLNKKMSGAEKFALSTTTMQKIAEAGRALGSSPIDHPKAYVEDVLKRHNLTPSGLAGKIGISASTISRAMNDPNHKFKFSLGTLQKIKEWDNAQPHD